VCQIEADSGRLLKCVTLPELQEPVDVALSDAGHLLIADAHQSAVLVVSLAGAATLLGRCGQGPGTADGQFQAQTLRAVTCATGHQVERIRISSLKFYRLLGIGKLRYCQWNKGISRLISESTLAG